MGIVTVGAGMALLALGCYFIFLSALRISLVTGYVTGALQILSGLFTALLPVPHIFRPIGCF